MVGQAQYRGVKRHCEEAGKGAKRRLGVAVKETVSPRSIGEKRPFANASMRSFDYWYAN